MGEMIRLNSADGHRFDVYRANPVGETKGGMVVIQEIFGVNVHIRSVVDDWANEGYTAIAPALYDRYQKGIEIGYDEAGVAEGRRVKGETTVPDALTDIQTTINELLPLGKVGVVGYCYGGMLAWGAATRLENVTCSVGYYGGGIPNMLDTPPKCPILLHFGEADAAIPLTDVDKIREVYPDVPIHVYPNAGHGFNCDMRGSYHEESAKIAKERSLEWFSKYL